MSCGSEYNTGSCVCDILRDIADAQSDIISDCTTSCEQSIADLLGDSAPSNDFDTVPVLLYCKGDCKPFKGYGAVTGDIADIVASFYFRVKTVDENCCAVLELLKSDSDYKEDPKSPVEQHTRRLEATGICITVDLNCFCHVTCLPAISAL